VFHHSRLERLARDKHLHIGPSFVSYKENEVLSIRLLGTYSQNVIFFVT
jgi:hypothetical protein